MILLKSEWFPHFTDDSVCTDAGRIEGVLESSYSSCPDCRSVYVAEKGGHVVAYLMVQWWLYLFLPVPEGYV
ncbi:MAG TPA: hypothetical protein ENL01_02955 [Chlorobaculum parvum]|uniref:Uncharacterized protein n=1 Tax=Chlorobaculum parvum TaxID=274539 RepID=A0A7C5DC19_9CHLB|nr:hypothetical protein [Chlorobaculum parvum]